MNTIKSDNPTQADGLDIRPWYKEPWPWVLIAIPLLTIIASGYTFYLAVTYPDYLVIEEEEYSEIVEDLRPSYTTGLQRVPGGQSSDEDNEQH